MKARLTIEVDYDGDITAMEAESVLQCAADHLAGEGLLSGETGGLVKMWSAKVEVPL